MNYYEVVIVNEEDKKERYLVKANTTAHAEKVVRKTFTENEIVSVKLTKYEDVLKSKK